jgi:hypothetical protein
MNPVKVSPLFALLPVLTAFAFAQGTVPVPGQPRMVDGRPGASLEAAYKDACQNGGIVIATAEYPGKEPLPVGVCDHHVEVLDLRQADSLTGRINVKRFGATGDGATDDTAAVRAAIAYSIAHMTGKAAPAIYFPAGTYAVKGELRITGRTTIVGDGQTVSTMKQMDPSANLFTVTRSRECSSGTCLGGLTNIGLAGNGHLSTGTLLEINDTEDYRIDHILMFNHGGRGLQVNGGSERLDSHDLSITLVRWPIILAKDANESYFYDTKVMFPGETADGWCYNINCVSGKYPSNGPVAPDPHAAIAVYMGVNVGFYGGSIKSLQMIGGFKAYNAWVTTLDHFYLEYGYVNPGVIAGGVSDWTTTTGPLSATGLAVPVKNTDWMAQYFTTPGDVTPGKSYTLYVLIPPDFAWNSKEPSSLGGGIAKGTYELVGVAGFAGDGAFHIGVDSRGMKNTTPRAWPAGTIIESYSTGIFGLRIGNSHINEQDEFSAMGAKGAGLRMDCDNTGVKTCAEIIAGYIPDGRWVQPHGSPGDNFTAGAAMLYLDNDQMFTGGPNAGAIVAHSRGFINISGAAGGPSDGETAEVPYTLNIAKITGGKDIELPLYANGHRPLFSVFDGSNGRLMSSDSGFFTQFASIPEGHGQYLNGRQYANSYSIFDIPPTGKHPLNSFTLLGGPNPTGNQGLRYDHWTGASWTNLFSVNANANNTADVSVNGILNARGLKIGDGPVVTSLVGGRPASGGAAAASPASPTLAGRTANIGGVPLTAGQCATGAAEVNGAAAGMTASTSPASPPGDGFVWQAFISRPNTVTVKVCAFAPGTPAVSAYDVRVVP